jgi:hypothetical protein
VEGLGRRPRTRTSAGSPWWVGRCRLTPQVDPGVTAWLQRLKPIFDEPVSNVDFICNLRRYISTMPCSTAWRSGCGCWAGAYTRPLFSSTSVVFVTDTLTPPSLSYEKCSR